MMTVDEYLAGAPEPQRTTLVDLRALLLTILPDADEGMSYGIPSLLVRGVPVAGYAYATRHCSYFPHSGSVIDQVEPELLDGYDWAKGTLRFPTDRAPDETLIRRLLEIKLAMLDESGN